MGNVTSSFFSGFGKAVGNVFGAPLDFLTGKNCSSICASTWDLICFIENFCVANLLKLSVVLVLLYIVLLFIYLLFKIGVCGCLCRGTYKMIWGCISSFFGAIEYVCTSILFSLRRRKRMKRELRDLEDYDPSSSSDEIIHRRSSYGYRPSSVEFRRSLSLRSRHHRRLHMQRSLRPRNHRMRVGISRGSSVYLDDRYPGRHGKHVKTVHDIKVTKTSKFVRKGDPSRYSHRRW